MAEKTSKKSTAGSKKVRSKPAKPTRPLTSEMVLAAVTALDDRKGSSLQAIKKYIDINYKLDMDKAAIFIRTALRKAVAEGVLMQAKGNGARGSFKLPSTEKKSVKASGEKRGRGRPPKSAGEGKKKLTPKKKKPGATTKKAGATSAKKPKVKTTATTKKVGRGRPKGGKSTPKKK